MRSTANAVPDSVVIRTASSGDAAAISEVATSSFLQAYGPHSKPDDIETHLKKYFSPAAVQQAIDAAEGEYLLATVSEQPAGMARFRKAECPLPGGATNAVELQQLYVLSATQGHGLGRQLVEQVFATARQLNAAGVWLSAWESADWATDFYRGRGFEELGKVEFKLGATTFTDILFWQRLD